jgi:predicted molibdopterin-dependent oxidoreductase YjgC
MYHNTETAQLADLVLPAAGWGEKDGTFINSERRIGTVRKVARAPGQALADFHIFKLIAEYWGCGEMFREWESPESVFQLLKRLSTHQPCDFTGIEGYKMLDECGGVQWPFQTDCRNDEQERRLFADGRFYHSDGRARFLSETPRSLPEQPNHKYPFLLLTGRASAAQWHTQTRTAKSAILRKLYAEELYVEINPQDAIRLGIRSGDSVKVASQRGSVIGRAVVSPCVQMGQVFIPMHYGSTNLLTNSIFDPYSHQPAYKSSAVSVEATS